MSIYAYEWGFVCGFVVVLGTWTRFSIEIGSGAGDSKILIFGDAVRDCNDAFDGIYFFRTERELSGFAA